MNPRPPVLFLDVDGVLNRCGMSGQGLETDKVAMLQEIIQATNCEIVISSTWRRLTDSALPRLLAVLRSIGAVVAGMTPILDDQMASGLWHGVTRGAEIASFLASNPEITKFVILDDDDDMGDLRPHLVNTNSFEGLTPQFTKEVIRRLNSQA